MRLAKGIERTSEMGVMRYRLAPREYSRRWGCVVRVSEDARRSTVLLGWPVAADDSAIKPEGTGFFIGHDRVPYLVTARHVAETLGSGPFVVRINGDDGRGVIEEVDNVEWHFHPDSAVDIAVTVYQPCDETMLTCLPSSEFATAANVNEWNIGPGDAAYVVGLFHLHIGKKRNLPVVHAGNIALMPSDEKIPVNKSLGRRGVDLVEAYLVEAHALPGASGSPVMVRPTIRFLAREIEDKGESLAIAEARDYLLGVWVANWPGRPSAPLKKALGLTPQSQIPIGMGLVIPADRIIDILSEENVRKERQAINDAEDEARAATPTSLSAQAGDYTDEEAARRAENAIRRSFAMPHQPNSALVGKTPRARAMARTKATKNSPKSR